MDDIHDIVILSACLKRLCQQRSRVFSTFFCTDHPYNYGRVPDAHPFSAGLISMDNPEYILNQRQQQRGSGGRGNYHTLGIPLVNHGSNNNSSPGSSQGPSSIHSAPGGGPTAAATAALPPSAAANSNGLPQPPPLFLTAPPPGRNAAAGLNGAVKKSAAAPRAPGGAGAGMGGSSSQHPRSSSAEESDDHEYYNDFDRLNRELQPLHPNRAVSGLGPVAATGTTKMQHGPLPSQQQQQQQQPKPLSPPPSMIPPGLQPISKHETTV